MRWPKGTIDEIGRHFMGLSEDRAPPKLLIYHHIPHEMAIVFTMFREPPVIPYGILLVGISSLRSSRCCWMKDFLAETPETSENCRGRGPQKMTSRLFMISRGVAVRSGEQISAQV
jgi:hypothetical protein